MPTYSEWLDSTRALYTTALTNAFNNRNNPDTDNSYYKAWQAMNAVGDLAAILPTNSAFYGGSPDGDEADILLFQGYLQSNPVIAGWLSLEPTLAFRADQRSSLGTAGTIGGQKRRWKGSPVYTFANGILVGKDDQIVAAIGTEGGEDLDGFGTDTIAYFDGVPFSTGTGVPGSVVFRGDTVVSGSIKGAGGVVIIDDVIQLETGVEAPAGIGVDSDGKIRLRNRGEGFLDLVDEISAVQANVDGAADTAANIAKLWQGVQNTSSAQWGTSLIPNSNFSFKTVDPTDGYSDRIVGVISVGTTNNIVTIPADGVCGFQGSSMGICLQAVPIESERYAIRIRYKGTSTETLDADGTEEGLFLSFHETSDDAETIGDNTFIYDNSTPGTGYEGSDVHISNVTVNYPTNTTSTDGGGATDGVSIQETYQVKSYLYVPSANTTAASLVIYTKNYVDVVSIDYVVMTESPLTTTQINDLIDEAVDDIDVEVDDPDISVVTDPQMTDSSLWAGYNGATLANSTDGLTTGGDKAITVSVPAGGGGITSSAIACESDRYLVGAKVRVLSSVGGVVPNISMFAIENPNQSYPTIGNPITAPLTFPYDDNVIKNIQIVEVNSSGTPDPDGAGSSVAVPIAELDGSEPLYTTVIGTYEVNVTYIDANGIEYSSFDPTIQTTAQLPGTFSLVVHADTECELSVDYVYGRLQGASVNIAQSLADTAYTDAHGFVTDMNEQLIRESGSIITNASMAILDSNNKPSGWRTDIATGTLTLDSTGDNSIQITQVPGFDSTTEKLRLITPPFNLGTADKFSIGVSAKGISSKGNANILVATSTDSILSSPYVTIANTDGGNPDVLAGATETAVGSSFATNTAAFENTLVTWNRGDVQQSHGGMGSIIIECDEDFEVDFVFVKEQTVSFNLADAQAVARREEAIRSAAGFVSSIGDSLVEEAGSFVTNAGFSNWYLDSTSQVQRPQKWMATRGASDVVRAISSSEVTITEPADLVTAATDKETLVTNKGINGSAIRFNPSITSGGILSSKFQLPVASSWTNPDSGTTETTTGSYTLSVRLKLDSANLVGVRLYAHELNTLPSAEIDHVFAEDGVFGTSTLEGSDRSSTGTPLDNLHLFTTLDTDPGMGESYDGRVQRIKLINVSQNDLSVGYDGDDDFGEGFDDEYIEYLPVDAGDDDGDQDGTHDQNVDVWYDISGTYKPHAEAKVVCFEILIEGDADNDGASSLIYVDYVSLITQPFDTDFAQTLADARAESIATIKTGELETTIGLDHADWSSYSGNTTLAELLVATKNSVDAVETTLAAEDPSTTLIPNSFFSMPDDTSTSVDDWIPTRSTTGTITRTVTPANNSYGSYVYLGSGSPSEETHGLLSKAISVLGNGVDTGLVDGGLTQNPNFDLVLRFRQNNGNPNQISWQMIAHEFWSDSLGANEYVFENGYGDLVTGQGGVEVFNGGVTGNAVPLQMIFTDETSPEDPLPTEEIGDNTSWRTLVATYTPTANARWVSFEFVLNEDYDNNNVRPFVQIDGILLQKSDSSPLALEIQAAAAAAQLATENNALDITTNADNITDNSDNITINVGNISNNTNDISNNTGNISSIQTSVGLMKAANTELFLIQTAMANETDSKIPNAAFLQPSSMTVENDDGEDVPNLAIPGSFLQFHRTPFLFRATNEFATNTAITSAYTDLGAGTSRPESVDTPYYDVGQNGTALIVPAVARNQDVVGFYTSAVIIPNAGGTGTSSGTQDPATGDNDFTGELSFDSRGQYTISFKVKNLSNVGTESITVSIKAHEYFDGIGPATEAGFITEASAGYQGFGAGTSTGIGTAYSSDNDQTITIIKLSDVSDTSFGSSETLAQVADVTTSSDWVTVGGTYTASADCECVSFSLSVDIDDNNDDTEAYDQNNDIGQFEWYNIFPALAVDFIYCASQSFTADMAEQITASRVYTVQQNLEENLTTLEDNLGAESDSLMPNGNFQQVYTDSSTEYIKNWMYTRALSSSGIQPSAAANGSIGTYVDIPLPSDSTTNTVGGGIISKSIEGLYTQAVQEGGSLGSYNLGLRCRGVTGLGSSTVSIGAGDQSSAGQYQQYISWYTSYSTYISGYDVSSSNYSYGYPTELYDTDSSAYRGLNISKLVDSYSPRYFRLDPPGSDTPRTLTHILPFTPQSGCKLIHLYIGLRIHSGWDMFNLSTWRVSTHNSSDNDINFGKISVAFANGYTAGGDVSNWVVKADEVDAFRTNYFTLPSSFKDNDNNWLRITIDAGTGGTDDALQYLNKVKITNETYGGGVYDASTYAYFSNPQWVEVFDPGDNSYTVQIIAHEYTGTSDPNTLYHSDTVTVPSGHTDNMTITSTGQVNLVPLNLIDLRYSESVASTEITISAFDQDTNEYITDWRNIVGSYTPSSSSVTATAFEFLFEGDPDADANYQTIHVDSVTMAASSLSTDLASTISDNRIFVEQKFIGGGSVVDQNSVIFNGDFAIASKTFPNNDTLFPSGWFPWYNYEDEFERDHGIDDSTIWGYGSNSSGTNRIVEWRPTMSSPPNTDTNNDGVIDGSDTYSGLLGMTSRPFKVGSNKYTFRMTYRVNAPEAEESDNVGCVITPYICYSAQDISPDVVSILSTVPALANQSIRPSTAITIDSNGNVMNDAGVNYSMIGFDGIAFVGYDPSGYGIMDPSGNDDPFGRIQVLEATWNVKAPLPNLDPAKWCCFNILCYASGADNLKVSSIEVFDVQLVPIGQAYGAGTLTTPGFSNPDWDDEDDVAPAAPRDTEAKEPLYNGTDIEIADISTISDTKDRLLMALPRKVFTSNTGTTVDTTKGSSGTSYLYPGVSDIEYASSNVSYSGKSGGRRQLIFGNNTWNEVVGVQRIEFNNWDDDDTNFAEGFGWELVRTGAHILSIRSGDTGNDPYYRFNFRGDGASGIGGFQLEVQDDPYVRTWNNGTTSNYTADAFVTLRPTREDFASGDTGVANDGRIRLEFWMGNAAYKENSSATGTDAGNFFGYMQNSYNALNITFTGQHRNVVKDTELLENNVGLIVVSTGMYDNLTHTIEVNKPHINEALPIIELSSKRNQKSVWGVISGEEDITDNGSSGKARSHLNGVWGSVLPIREGEADRLIVNSLGEGAIWICNINGNLENGDYITTCEIPGYGMLQDDDLLHNYTVAKITQDCTFELDNPNYDCVEFEFEGNTYRKAFVGCTYHCG